MSRYEEAKKIYAAMGVDTEEALGKLKDVTYADLISVCNTIKISITFIHKKVNETK